MPKEKKPAQSIETYLKQIEDVVDKLESGEIDLEEAIKNYEKGMDLIEKCRDILKQSKLKVEYLKKKAASPANLDYKEKDGYAVEPEDEAGAEEKKDKGLF
jgi:exodeoxyribonuclease VII small subunit